MSESQRMVLLNPGPVTLSDRVRATLTAGDWCHREPEFATLTQAINTALVRVYPPMEQAYDAVMMTGSGTCAVESMLATFAPDRGKTLVVANGVYGERMARMLEVHTKPHLVCESAWTAPMDLAAVQGRLDADAEIACVAAVHHETTTGRLNDLDSLARVCADRHVPLLLDCVSSFGAEMIDVENWDVAAIAGTANKCLHGVPGISFVVARKTLWSAPKQPVGSVYLDLHAYHKSQHGDGYSPFTQSVQSAFALHEALAELQDQGGWMQRRIEYLTRAKRIADTLKRAGVETLMPRDDFSSVLWSYRLPQDVDYTAIHDMLKRDGFVIYAGQGQLANSIFRIAQMGDIHESDLRRLCDSLASVFAAKTP